MSEEGEARQEASFCTDGCNSCQSGWTSSRRCSCSFVGGKKKKSLFVGTAASYAEDPVTEDARITRSQETRVAARHRNPSPSPGCSDRTGVLAEA